MPREDDVDQKRDAPLPLEPPGREQGLPNPQAAPRLVSSPKAVREGNGLISFYLHLHPRLVRRRSSQIHATLGLGLAALVALGIATLSGLLLMVYYVPSIERAHASVQDIISVVPLGAFTRNLHRWSAHASVLLLLAHLLRTLLWGAYRGAHRRVWLLGACLLVVTLATSYSGYLLPWDQDAYWTVTVGTSLMGYVPLLGDWLKQIFVGEPTIGQAALTRFFLLHVLALPAVGLMLLTLHLFRLRRVGGLARPREAQGPGEELVAARSSLIGRELFITLLLCLILVLLSLGFDAKLGPLPDLLRPENPPKAPWFLVGIQEMVSYSVLFGGVIFPILLLGALCLGPWIDGRPDNDGAFLRGRMTRIVIPAAMIITAGATLAAIIWWGDPQMGQASWLNPASIAGMTIATVTLVGGLVGRSRSLAVMSLLSAMFAAMLVFTLIGWFGRGPDWTLIYHPGPGQTLIAPEAANTPEAAKKGAPRP